MLDGSNPAPGADFCGAGVDSDPGPASPPPAEVEPLAPVGPGAAGTVLPVMLRVVVESEPPHEPSAAMRIASIAASRMAAILDRVRLSFAAWNDPDPDRNTKTSARPAS